MFRTSLFQTLQDPIYIQFECDSIWLDTLKRERRQDFAKCNMKESEIYIHACM